MKALIFRETGEPKSVFELAEIPTPPLAQADYWQLALISFVDEVAVGTIIADRPPHRSVRALISAYGSYLG